MHPQTHTPHDAREIGRRVREARESQGLRQEDVALAAGVSTRVVHQVEQGKPTSRLDSLTRVLGVLGLGLAVTDRSIVNRPGHKAESE